MNVSATAPALLYLRDAGPLLPCSRSDPARLNGLRELAGSGETAIRDPLYVFAVSDELDSGHDSGFGTPLAGLVRSHYFSSDIQGAPQFLRL